MTSFNVLESRRRSWNTQTVLLFVYSAVVTCALVLVVCKNFESPEQIVVEEQMAAAEKMENAQVQAANNMAVPEVYVDAAAEDAESFDNPDVEWTVEGEENQPEVKQDVLMVEKGDHFIGLLQRIGMEYLEANQAAEALKEAGYDVRGLRAGQKIDIVKTVDVPFGELLSVDKITYNAGRNSGILHSHSKRRIDNTLSGTIFNR